MPRTNVKKIKEVDERAAIQEEDSVESDASFIFDSDFSVEDEFKVAPLVPNGKYEGHVTSVKPDAANCALVWEVTLMAGEDVLMSDNETPVNGNVLHYTNWFPKAGDENVRTKTGKMTKRQAKINMLHDFQRKMRINMNTPDDIYNAINNAEWIGFQVIATVEIREWEGRLSNQIKEMCAA